MIERAIRRRISSIDAETLFYQEHPAQAHRDIETRPARCLSSRQDKETSQLDSYALARHHSPEVPRSHR
jgi:hypothetical protein